jgi:hypothetical protein
MGQKVSKIGENKLSRIGQNESQLGPDLECFRVLQSLPVLYALQAAILVRPIGMAAYKKSLQIHD